MNVRYGIFAVLPLSPPTKKIMAVSLDRLENEGHIIHLYP